MRKIGINTDRFHNGHFKILNENKYVGNISDIVYRSSYERKFCVWCDSNPEIVKWASESIEIPYISPIDGKSHRYYPDFWIQFDNGQKVIIEVKPFAQTVRPLFRQDKANNLKYIKNYNYELKQFAVNYTKWIAAKKYCDDRGWKFRVITEKELGIK